MNRLWKTTRYLHGLNRRKHAKITQKNLGIMIGMDEALQAAE